VARPSERRATGQGGQPRYVTRPAARHVHARGSVNSAPARARATEQMAGLTEKWDSYGNQDKHPTDNTVDADRKRGIGHRAATKSMQAFRRRRGAVTRWVRNPRSASRRSGGCPASRTLSGIATSVDQARDEGVVIVRTARQGMHEGPAICEALVSSPLCRLVPSRSASLAAQWRQRKWRTPLPGSQAWGGCEWRRRASSERWPA
jgi:hypothetical protein